MSPGISIRSSEVSGLFRVYRARLISAFTLIVLISSITLRITNSRYIIVYTGILSNKRRGKALNTKREGIIPLGPEVLLIAFTNI
jgi:hypothetical protein